MVQQEAWLAAVICATQERREMSRLVPLVPWACPRLSYTVLGCIALQAMKLTEAIVFKSQQRSQQRSHRSQGHETGFLSASLSAADADAVDDL